MKQEQTARAWRVERGAVHIYRLFDVADAIDLQKAEALVSAPTSRVKLEGSQTTTAIEIAKPPLNLSLGTRTLPLVTGARSAEVTARLFDHGVISILYRIPIALGTSLDELLPVSEELITAPTPALDTAARNEAEELARALVGALDHPHHWDGHETYHVIFVESFVSEAGEVDAVPITARTILAEAPLARLLLGETSPTPLSKAERIDVLKHHYSYLANDLAVVDWNSAFVYEPSGVRDIPDLLEFATAHLLELRFYDALLDRELTQIYDEVEKGRQSFSVLLSGRYRRLQRRTAALLLDLSEMTERLENTIKLIGDFYLARLYQSAIRRFRLPAWQETVLRKQRLLSEVHTLMSSAVDTKRAQLMELAIIVLILGDIVLALRPH